MKAKNGHNMYLENISNFKKEEEKPFKLTFSNS